MADNTRDLKVRLKLEADTSQLGNVSKLVADQLKAAGVAFDPVTNAYKSIAQNGNNIAETGKKIVENANDMAVNLNRAKGEAVALVQQFVSGNVSVGGLARSVGALGPAFAIAAVATFGIYKGIADASAKIVEINSAIIDEVNATEEAIRAWERLAGTADEVSDSAKLAEKIAEDLAVAAANYQRWRTTELGLWKTFIDTIASMWSAIPGFGARPMQEAQDEAAKAARNNEILQIQAAVKVTDDAARGIANWKRQQEDFATGIPEVEARIKGLNTAIAEQTELRRAIAAEGLGMSDQEKRDATMGSAEIARLNEQLAQEESHLKTLNKKQEAADRKAAADATRGEAAAHRELRESLAAEKLQLEAIQNEIANIESSPFLTTESKNAALTQLIPSQIATINAMIADNRTLLERSIFDPSQHNALQSAIQRDEAAITSLQQKMQLTTFSGQFRASLVSFVNQFGTTAQQVGNLITSTIGTAVSGVSNAITGAIFRTQSWGQAFAQVAQQIISNLINIVIQWAVQRGIIALLNITFGQVEATASNAMAGQSAAAWAPAAVAASIASYGVAATAGLSAFTTAELAGVALARGLAVGFEAGGFTGPGSSREVAGVVHRGEYVMPKSTVDRAGVGAMDSLRSAIDSGGGRGGGGGVAIYNFTDMKALEKAFLNSSASKKFIVNTVNTAGGNLRT